MALSNPLALGEPKPGDASDGVTNGRASPRDLVVPSIGARAQVAALWGGTEDGGGEEEADKERRRSCDLEGNKQGKVLFFYSIFFNPR
jgi:hypothetical protein